MVENPTLVIMAAGMGSRYGGLKQLDPVGPSGEVIMEYSVFDALRAGFGRVVFIIRRDIEEEFRARLVARLPASVAVDYVFQEYADLPAGFRLDVERKKPWGTGQAIWACRKAVREPFAAINADDFYGRETFAVLAARLRALAGASGHYCMAGYVLEKTLSEFGPVSRAVCQLDQENGLVRIDERLKIQRVGGRLACPGDADAPELTGREYVSMNFWGLTPAFFGDLERLFVEFLQAHGRDPAREFLVPFAVQDLIRRGARVEVLPTAGQWFGITYPEDKAAVCAQVCRLVEQGLYPAALWQGVK